MGKGKKDLSAKSSGKDLSSAKSSGPANSNTSSSSTPSTSSIAKAPTLSAFSSKWFSPNPQKAAVEQAWIEYSFVWISIIAVVMLTGLGSYWGDNGLMILASSLMMGGYLWPVWRAPILHFPTMHSMFYGNVALSFTMHYIATPFFFDVLHMRYGFNVKLRVDRNPVFLYLLTVPYFLTYSVLACLCSRRASHLFRGRMWNSNKLVRYISSFVRGAIISTIPFGLALGETITNANPAIADLFCYDDRQLALTFGTFAYGVGFVFSIPVWLHGVPEILVRLPVEEMKRPKGFLELFFSWRSRFWHNMFGQILAACIHGICLWWLRKEVAPLLTVVEANSFPSGGCLAPPRRVSAFLSFLFP